MAGDEAILDISVQRILVFVGEVDEESSLHLTAEALRKAICGEPVAIICGGETGVKAPAGSLSFWLQKGCGQWPGSLICQVADALSELMGLRGNTTADGMTNRRDKQVQQDAVKAAGLRAVRSVCGD